MKLQIILRQNDNVFSYSQQVSFMKSEQNVFVYKQWEKCTYVLAFMKMLVVVRTKSTLTPDHA